MSKSIRAIVTITTDAENAESVLQNIPGISSFRIINIERGIETPGIPWTRPGDCEHAIDDRLLYEVQNGNGETYIAEYNADHFIDTKTGRRVAAERFRSIGTLEPKE